MPQRESPSLRVLSTIRCTVLPGDDDADGAGCGAYRAVDENDAQREAGRVPPPPSPFTGGMDMKNAALGRARRAPWNAPASRLAGLHFHLNCVPHPDACHPLRVRSVQQMRSKCVHLNR